MGRWQKATVEQLEHLWRLFWNHPLQIRRKAGAAGCPDGPPFARQPSFSSLPFFFFFME